MSKTSEENNASLQKRERLFFASTPKWVLFAMCQHLAAKDDGDSYEESLETGSYLARLHEEWVALHSAGVVSKKPPKAMP